MIGLLDEALRSLNLPAGLFAVVPGICPAAVATTSEFAGFPFSAEAC